MILKAKEVSRVSHQSSFQYKLRNEILELVKERVYQAAQAGIYYIHIIKWFSFLQQDTIDSVVAELILLGYKVKSCKSPETFNLLIKWPELNSDDEVLQHLPGVETNKPDDIVEIRVSCDDITCLHVIPRKGKERVLKCKEVLKSKRRSK